MIHANLYHTQILMEGPPFQFSHGTLLICPFAFRNNVVRLYLSYLKIYSVVLYEILHVV